MRFLEPWRWLAATLLVAAGTLRAQTPAPTAPEDSLARALAPPAATAPPVEELVAAALARAPSITALRERLAAAREQVAPAGALPDPMIEVMYQDVGFPRYTVGKEEMSMIGVEVRQGLFYPGKRRARREAARAETSLRQAELGDLKRQVVAEVRGLYARLYAIDRERRALTAARELLQMLASTVAGRYSAGEAQMEAQVKAQLEVSRLDERLDDLAAARQAAVAALGRWLDRPGGSPVGEVTQLPDVSPPPEPWEALITAHSPEVAVRQAAVVAALRRVEVERRELSPDLFAGAGFASRDGFDPVVTLRVGTEFPFWKGRKQRPLLRAALHEAAEARAELRDAEAKARAEAARLAADWRRSEAQVRRYRDAIVPQSSTAMEAARASYVTGRGDFSTVIEDFNLWFEARLQLASREAERFTTWAEIDALTTPAPGSSPEEDKP